MSTIDLTGIGALISTLTGLLVAGGSLLLQRQRKSAVDADDMEDELEVRTRQFAAAMRHIRRLEDDRATYTDLAPLRRPAELRPGWFQQQQRTGRKRRAAARDDEGTEYEEEGGVAPLTDRPRRRRADPAEGGEYDDAGSAELDDGYGDDEPPARSGPRHGARRGAGAGVAPREGSRSRA